MLDSVEQSLPPVPRRLFQLNRSVAEAAATTACQTAKMTRAVAEAVMGRSAQGAKTVQGQAEAAADRVTDAVTRGTKEVAGQTSAQAQAIIDEAEDLTVSLIEDVAPTPEASTSAVQPYEQWTKTDLYQRAQQLDVPGRSSMSKSELINALRQTD